MLYVYPVAVKSPFVLGDCPRIAILFRIEEYLKKIATGIPPIFGGIPRIIFLSMTKSLAKRAFSNSLPGDIAVNGG